VIIRHPVGFLIAGFAGLCTALALEVAMPEGFVCGGDKGFGRYTGRLKTGGTP